MPDAQIEWCGHLWQERFFSTVLDEAHAIATMRYVECNPIRAYLCRAPHEWRWSSARGNLGLVTDPLLDQERPKQLIPQWEEFLFGFSAAEQVEAIRINTRTGRPLGSDQFMGEMERRTGEVLRKRRPGPRKVL